MLAKIKFILSNRYIWSAFLFSICLIGIIIIIYSTVWGAALSDDSYYYISPARNLLSGRGFDLTPHFPPLLPLLLSAIGIFKVDPLISIRWVNAMLFGLNIYLVARIIYRLTDSRVFSLMGAIFALISSTVIMIHSWAMSEALFIALTLCGLMVYAHGYQKDGWRVPVITGLFFGLAAATRYIGVSLLLAGALLWLIERGINFRRRFFNSLIFSINGIIPLALWIIHNEIITGRPTTRVFAVHLIPASSWVNMLNTILLWFIPGRLVNGKELFWLVGIAVLVVIGLVFYLWQMRKRGINSENEARHMKPILLILLNILAYLFVLIVSRSFFDDRIPMDERLLSPILVMGLMLAVWIFAWRWKAHRWQEMSVIVFVILMVLVTNLTRSTQMVQSYHANGRGYASARDHISETYAYLRNRPDVPVYSNASAAIYFWTGRVTYPIPSSSAVQAMKVDMQKTGALLVVFDSIRVELYGVTRDELTNGLVEQIRLSEATIYRSP
jgi:4-amino-4-deoxy-L-arabinose transferase-like glycosyltransferase